MSIDPRTAGKSHVGVWTVVVSLVLVMYVATWPIIELGNRVKEDNSKGMFAVPVVQKPPEWARIMYHPLHALRGSFDGKNVLADYWRWWNDKLVIQPLRKRTQEFQERMNEMLRQSEQRLREAEQSLQRYKESRREQEQRVLELFRKPAPIIEQQNPRIREA